MRHPASHVVPDSTQGNVLEALTEQLARVAEQLLRQSDALEHLRGNIINSVLFSGTVRLDANGICVLQGWTVPAGSMWASNRCASLVTIVAGDGGWMGGDPPTSGAGIFGLPADLAETYPVSGGTVTFIGPPDGLVTVVVWASAARPQAGGVA